MDQRTFLDERLDADDRSGPGGDELDRPDDPDHPDQAMSVPRRTSPLGGTGRWLVALVLAAGGFVGGVLTTQQVEESSATAGLPEGLELPEGVELPEGFELPEGVELPAGAGAGGGLLGGAGAVPGAGQDTYTVKLLDGDVLYVEDARGATVKVVLDDDVQVRTLQRGRLGGLDAGDEVVIEGADEEQGRLRAERISQTGQ